MVGVAFAGAGAVFLAVGAYVSAWAGGVFGVDGAEASVAGAEDLAVGAEVSALAGAVDGEDGDLTHSGIHFGTHSGAEASVGVADLVAGAEASVVGVADLVAGAVGTLTSQVSGTHTDQFIMVEV